MMLADMGAEVVRIDRLGENAVAQSAGHDLNYIGLTGLLHQIGPTGGKPVVPLNVIGDFGGGGLLLAFGVMCAPSISKGVNDAISDV
jgi:crotonobetainyl-CoA:carnitine CoA-transferase CaiB-like acyl-CoA transferase